MRLRKLICRVLGHHKMSLSPHHQPGLPYHWFGSWRCERCGIEK